MDDADLFDRFVTLNSAVAGSTAMGFRAKLPTFTTAISVGRRASLGSAFQNLPKLPVVYADFVVNPAFNAFAFKHKDRYFIAFHDGLPVILATVTYRILADGRLFPQIGDPKAESSNLPLFSQLAPNAVLLSAANPEAVIPKNAHRQLYAIHLCHLVFDFLAAHEITHIAHGHVDYRKAERGIPYVSEVDWLPSTPGGNLESQAMELDADGTAASVFVNTVKAMVSSRVQMLPEVAEFYQDPAGAMFDVAVAVSIMFRLFGDSRMNGCNLSGKSHPPMRWRQMMILNMMGNYVDQSWDSSLVGPVEAAFTEAIADIEESFELITGSSKSEDYMMPGLATAGLTPQPFLTVGTTHLGRRWRSTPLSNRTPITSICRSPDPAPTVYGCVQPGPIPIAPRAARQLS